jgi:micrococcal nuclease
MSLFASSTALVLLVSATAFASNFSGKVVGISDGDTIRVLHNGRAERIRLNGIDCPELHQPFGARAKLFTSSLAFGKTVNVDVTGTDRYQRTIAQITLPDSRNLERELVRAGLAWWYRQYSNDPILKQLEREARAAKRGLWIEPQPTPPWEYRKFARSQHRKLGTKREYSVHE